MYVYVVVFMFPGGRLRADSYTTEQQILDSR